MTTPARIARATRRVEHALHRLRRREDELRVLLHDAAVSNSQAGTPVARSIAKATVRDGRRFPARIIDR